MAEAVQFDRSAREVVGSIRAIFPDLAASLSFGREWRSARTNVLNPNNITKKHKHILQTSIAPMVQRAIDA